MWVEGPAAAFGSDGSELINRLSLLKCDACLVKIFHCNLCQRLTHLPGEDLKFTPSSQGDATGSLRGDSDYQDR